MYQIYADGVLIYDSTLEDYKIVKGVVTLEADKSGSFVFALYPDHFYYNSIVRMRTVVTVYKAGRLVFRGRVLDDSVDYHNRKELTCEGELGFLRDSIIRPYSFSGTPEALFHEFVEEHNAQVDEFKRFKIGACTVVDPNGYIARANAAYEDAYENMTAHLTETTAGGHFYITHGEDGRDEVPTLNYLADYPNKATQPIEFGVNLRDYSKKVNAADIATAVIPLGAKIDDGDTETEDPYLTIAGVNNGVDYVFSKAGVELYGWIFKTVEWDDVTEADNLKAKAQEYVESAVNSVLTVELSAIDMHMLDASIDSYSVCEYITINSAPHGFSAVMLCNKQTLDLLKPENDSVTLGHTYATFTETSTRALTTAARLSKAASSALVNSATIVSIISRLDALEGVTVVVTVSDALGELDRLYSAGALMVAGRLVTSDNASIVVTGGSAEISYTLNTSLATARSLRVNGSAVGTVSAMGSRASTTVPVKTGSVIEIEFTEV